MYILIRRNFKKSYNNIAFCLERFCGNLKVKIADETIKSFDNEASYYIEQDKYTQIFTRLSRKARNIGYGHKYEFYMINGKLYYTYYSNSYEEIKKIFSSVKKKYSQLSLF